MDMEYQNVCLTYQAYGFAYSGDTLYILSNLELLPITYDPIPLMPNILMALLQIGQSYSYEEDISLAVQSFCVRYGMLNFEDGLVQKQYDDNSVKFYAGNILGRKAATAKEYDALFNPFQQEHKRQREKVRVAELPPLVGSEPMILELNYSNAEAVDWYGLYGRQLYDLLRRFQAGEQLTLTPGNIDIHYEATNGLGCRRVYFDSLLSLCNFFMMEMLVSPRPAIRLCKRCGKPLLPRGTRTEYCSTSCRNVMNVVNSRKRRRGTGK